MIADCTSFRLTHAAAGGRGVVADGVEVAVEVSSGRLIEVTARASGDMLPASRNAPRPDRTPGGHRLGTVSRESGLAVAVTSTRRAGTYVESNN
jgi:hypothetical protein